MIDHLATLADEAADRIRNGYYARAPVVARNKHSLREAVRNCSMKNAIIAEIKFSSPSHGRIRASESAERVARQMFSGGACALSILTAPGSFGGDLSYLADVAKSFELPILMKDIIVSPVQLQAAAKMGADAAVLIAELYANGLSEYTLSWMRAEARRLGLECLLEACTQREYSTLEDLDPDLYGVNNRNLSSLKIDLNTTTEILSRSGKPKDAPIVSESGIETPEDVRRLSRAGADAFLVGTSVMRAENVENKVRELVNA